MKYFTPLEARKTLPLVRKIAQDILSVGQELKRLEKNSPEKLSTTPGFFEKVEELKEFFEELKEIGCEYKDFDYAVGIVDFPSIINNEEVYLCYRLDEPDILYYHSAEGGFSGRKLIPPDYLEM